MQREQLARGGGGSSRDDDEGVVVMLRRSSAAARVTCGLCRGLVRDATTVPECLHSFCRSCIYEKFADEEDSCCPTCNIDLGCSPLDKIRADHNLQSVREKLFPSKRQKNEGVPSLHPAAITEEEEEGRIKKVWWNRVQEIDELKDSTRVFTTFTRTSINKALEEIVTVGEYHRQLELLRQQKAELCEQAERWFKSDKKSLVDSLDYEKVETKKLREEKEYLKRTGLEPVKLVEKKRKVSVTEFNLVRFKVKTRKSTKSFGVPVVSDQNISEDQATDEVLVQNTSQTKVPEDKVVEEAPEQASVPALVLDPVVILTPSVEVDVPEGFQQVSTPVGNSFQSKKFPFCPQFIEDKKLDEVWRKVSDRQAETDPDTFFTEYNDMAIRHMVENYAMMEGLIQRIKNLEEKHSELKNLEKIKEEVVAKEAIITKLEEECQAKDRSIAYTTTRHKEVIETFEKKIAEQTQAIIRAEKALELEQDKGAGLVQSLDEKIIALNKMIFDMGSGSSLPTLRDPTKKVNYFGQLLEDLKGLLKTTRENYVQTMKEAMASGVSFALAKLKASDLSINLQAVEEDFDCLPEDATKFLEEVRPLGDKVAEEMEVGSPSSSN